jgi:hypothetical protein
VFDGTENEKCEILDSNNCNKCDDSTEDFWGFRNQKKLHSALQFLGGM